MDGGAWWALVHGVAKSQTQLSDFTFHFHDFQSIFIYGNLAKEGHFCISLMIESTL